MRIPLALSTAVIALVCYAAILAGPVQMTSPTASPPPAVIGQFTAGGTGVTKGKVVATTNTEGWVRSADNVTAFDAVGIALEGGAAGTKIKVATFGSVTSATLPGGVPFIVGESYGLAQINGRLELMTVLLSDSTYTHKVTFVGVATGPKTLHIAPVFTGKTVTATPPGSGS